MTSSNDALEQAISYFEQRDGSDARAVELLRIILPMAKGYAAEHKVGRNAEMVGAAEDYLATLRSTQSETAVIPAHVADKLEREHCGAYDAQPSASEAEPEKWRAAIDQKPTPCACRFEWRAVPDFSGVPSKQIDECGFHAEQRFRFEAELAAIRAYAKANPLGGPATMFRAIADRIEAGEDYYAVLSDYGLSGDGGSKASEDDELGIYTRTDGHREWWSGGAWLYPGDAIVLRRQPRAAPSPDGKDKNNA